MISAHVLLPSWYLSCSLITFLVYAVDKKAACRGRWRTSERTLHFLSLAGGWPGAFIAQRKLRHKTKKQPFRRIFWCTVFCNCCLLLGFFYAAAGHGRMFWH